MGLMRLSPWTPWSRAFNSPPAVRLGAAILCFSSTSSDALIATSNVLPAAAGVASAAATAGRVKTGVLIHGLHLRANGWRSVMWGDEETQRLGRLPHAVRLAWEENACVVAIGTGASEKDGVLEGRWALNYLASNWDRLAEFQEAFSGVDLQEMRKKIELLLVAEGRSRNTREELLEAGRLFREVSGCKALSWREIKKRGGVPLHKAECTRVILVSSPTHLPRCLRDACSLWYGSIGPESSGEPLQPDKMPQSSVKTAEKNNLERKPHGDRHQKTSENGQQNSMSSDRNQKIWRPLILASPCHTSFEGYGPEDLVIIEPPHRGDDAAVALSASLSQGGEGVGEGGVEEGASPQEGGIEERPPPMLHELAARALKASRGERSARFRQELDALLRRYLDDEG